MLQPPTVLLKRGQLLSPCLPGFVCHISLLLEVFAKLDSAGIGTFLKKTASLGTASEGKQGPTLRA